ncbi:hypothetical protein K6U19_04960 [Vibrio fluvialis]|uniref:hypothetical protein n=1 Tax=Vibrio TaxID=662 RepID=UPI001EECB452|nr:MULTISPECIES: hypothetical protein [Vibrio]MCG6340599.1 hypothetical protein [Vibrio fluvialis]MDF2155025.1 hypothetical protein [Vibrio sp. CAU 1672]
MSKVTDGIKNTAKGVVRMNNDLVVEFIDKGMKPRDATEMAEKLSLEALDRRLDKELQGLNGGEILKAIAGKAANE